MYYSRSVIRVLGDKSIVLAIETYDRLLEDLYASEDYEGFFKARNSSQPFRDEMLNRVQLRLGFNRTPSL